MAPTPQGPKLFHPHVSCAGVLKCAVEGCGALFITGAYARSLKRKLAAHGRPTAWISTPEAERASRRAHAQRHAERGEATYAADGFFRLHVEPAKPRSAHDFGFTPVSS